MVSRTFCSRHSLLLLVVTMATVRDVISAVMETRERHLLQKSDSKPRFHYPRLESRDQVGWGFGRNFDDKEKLKYYSASLASDGNLKNPKLKYSSGNIHTDNYNESRNKSSNSHNYFKGKENIMSDLHGILSGRQGENNQGWESGRIVRRELPRYEREEDGVMSFRIGDQTINFPSLDAERNPKYKFKFGKKSTHFEVENNCETTHTAGKHCVEGNSKIAGSTTKSSLKNAEDSSAKQIKFQSSQGLNTNRNGINTAPSVTKRQGTDSKLSSPRDAGRTHKQPEASNSRVKRLSKLDLLENADDILSDLAETGKNKAKFKFGKRGGSSRSPLTDVSEAPQIDPQDERGFLSSGMIFLPGNDGYFPVVVRRSSPLPREFGLFGSPVSTGHNRYAKPSGRYKPVRSLNIHRDPDLRFKFGKR